MKKSSDEYLAVEKAGLIFRSNKEHYTKLLNRTVLLKKSSLLSFMME